jgi:hypothetical protein
MDTSWLPFITGGTGAVVVLALVAWAFYAGKVHSDPEFKREVERREAEERRSALLEQALKEKDSALTAANDRADAAVRASELIADAFSQARQRRAGQGRPHG